MDRKCFPFSQVLNVPSCGSSLVTSGLQKAPQSCVKSQSGSGYLNHFPWSLILRRHYAQKSYPVWFRGQSWPSTLRASALKCEYAKQSYKVLFFGGGRGASDWLISIHLSSVQPILSSVISSLLLNPFGEFLNFDIFSVPEFPFGTFFYSFYLSAKSSYLLNHYKQSLICLSILRATYKCLSTSSIIWLILGSVSIVHKWTFLLSRSNVLLCLMFTNFG